VGRLSPEKGIAELLSEWPSGGPLLKVVGDGPLEGKLRAERWPQAQLLGRLGRAELHSLMSAACCMILPSRCYENFPVTLIEAYAAGLPVLARRVGALEELVEEGKTGALYGNPEELKRGLESLMLGESEACAERCRALHAARYSPAENLRLLMKIYTEAGL